VAVPKRRRRFTLKRLEVIETGDGVLSRKAQSTIDLIGSSKRSFDEMKRRLDEIRREDA
jgi:hypothetical protein